MYDWIQTTFNIGEGLAQGIALVISLTVVLVLFALFISIIRRLMGGRAPQGRGRQPRIALMDSTAIDTRRRLLLVRRDNVEHLILIGGPSDVVVEQNIIRSAPLAAGMARAAGFAAVPSAGQVKAPMAPGPGMPVDPAAGSADVAEPAVPAPAPSLQPRAPAAPDRPAPTPAKLSQVQIQPPSPPVGDAGRTPEISLPDVGGKDAAPQGVGTPTASRVGAAKPAVSATAAAAASPARKRLMSAMQDKLARKDTGPAPAPAAAALEPIGTPAAPAAPEPALKPAHAPAVPPAGVDLTAPDKPSAATEGQKAASDEQDKPDGSVLRPAPRPFSPKDRPSYGSGRISPPASGPAARARTAVVSAPETSGKPDRIEPVLGSSGPGTAAAPVPDTPLSSGTTGPGTSTSHSREDRPGSAAQTAAPSASKSSGEAQAAAPASAPITDSSSADTPSAPLKDAARPADPLKSAGEPGLAAEPEGSGLDRSTDVLGDILADGMEKELPPGNDRTDAPKERDQEMPATETAAKTPADPKTPEQAGGQAGGQATTAPEPTPHKATGEISGKQTAAGTPSGTPSENDSTDNRQTATPAAAPATRFRQPAVTPAPAGGLGSRNPIEEEMAKILDELGGQPKQ